MSEPGKRLFVGVRVSVATANALAAAGETLARRARDAAIAIRWVPPVNYHVTLRFLGWTREAAIGAVRDALVGAAEGTPRIAFRTARLGAFRSLEKANIVWAGVEDPTKALDELAKRIEAASAGLGYAPERRAFHAHVTLGRLAEARAIREVVLPIAEQMFGETRVEAVSLFESETKSTGSVYRELCKIPFKTPSEAGFRTSERQSAAVQLDPSKPSSETSTETDDGWPRGHLHHDDP